MAWAIKQFCFKKSGKNQKIEKNCQLFSPDARNPPLQTLFGDNRGFLDALFYGFHQFLREPKMNEGFQVIKLFPDYLTVEHEGSEDFAEWSLTNWGDCLLLGIPMSRLVEAVCNISAGSILNKEAYKHEESLCYPSILFYLPAEAEESAKNLNSNLIVQSLKAFSSLIMANKKCNLDLGEKAVNDKVVFGIVKEHARKFLEKKGGDRLSSPIRLACFNEEWDFTGKFLPKPLYPYTKPVYFTYCSKVVAMETEERACILKKTEKDKLFVYYRENEDFSKIKEMLGEPLISQFTLEKTRQADGKEMIRINNIGEIMKDPTLLI